MFESLQARYSNKLSVNFKFDNRLAKFIYAGSDMFLTPSRFEPCGLGQLIAMKYGSIPLVRKLVGCLIRLKTFHPKVQKGTGFVSLKNYRSEDLLYDSPCGRGPFINRKIWKELFRRAMMKDFSWDTSAQRYLELDRHIQRK